MDNAPEVRKRRGASVFSTAKAPQSRPPHANALPVGASILMMAFIVITPLAYASPGDPTWMPGIYDEADYDEAVSLLGDTIAVLNSIEIPKAFKPVASLGACAFAAVAGIALFLALLFRAPPANMAMFVPGPRCPCCAGRAPPGLMEPGSSFPMLTLLCAAPLHAKSQPSPA